MTTEGFKASIDTMSFSAKAGKVALQALAMAGNMVAMWAITEAIGAVVSWLNSYTEAAANAKEGSEAKKSTVSSNRNFYYLTVYF